ncbi:hypothetical protein LINPERPRIM_LOCUS17647, partial [Linum perenne]
GNSNIFPVRQHLNQLAKPRTDVKRRRVPTGGRVVLMGKRDIKPLGILLDRASWQLSS